MKRTSTAVLLAALLLSAWPTDAGANHPKQCGPFCSSLFSKIHQHGPLFNYGPYYGYPPFEPYGPWNSYLQYNPWYYGDPNAAAAGRTGHGRLFDGSSRGCRGCGFHAHWLSGGWFRGHGCLSCGHGGHRDRGGLFAGRDCGHGLFKGKCGTTSAGCSTCAASADPHTTDAVARYAGAGDPRESAQFYTGLPTLDPTFVK